MPASNDPLACCDLIAERRYAYGEAAAGDGNFEAAAEMFEQALERAPEWPPALFALGAAREKLGRRDEATEAFRRALEADPSDMLGAAARLSLLGGAKTPDALPRAYVTRLFDSYARRFDAHVVGALAYRGPHLIVAALDDAAPGRRFAKALDIGCGTGLMGAAVRDRVARLEGVDLAPAMIAKAREPGLYDALEAGDAVRRLQNSPPCAFDLILAADALCYFGDLRPVFAGCRRALADDGIFAFTVETFDGVGFRLLESLRFAHASAYVEDTACSAGFRPIFLQRASARREADVEAPGLIAAFAAGHGHSRP